MFSPYLEYPPWTSPKWILQILIFLPQTRRQFYFLYQQLQQTNILTLFEGANPPKWTPKNLVLHDQIHDACVFDVSTCLRGKCFDMVWGYHPPPNGNQFFQQLVLHLQFLFCIVKHCKDKHFNIF